MYNRLVRFRNRSENAWAQVDVQLRKRYDLIPNLVETVKGYAAHERGTFEAVTAARTAAQQAQGVAQQAAAENVLTHALRRLLAVAVVAAAITAPAAAAGRSYDLLSADTAAAIQPDGSVLVREQLTPYFFGDFTFGFRDIPIRPRESIDQVTVSEQGQPYRPGGTT